MAWTKAQQHRSQTYFGEIGWREALRTRVSGLLKSERTAYKQLRSGGSTFFALKVQTPRQQPFLVALTDLDDPGTERVVVDPDVIDPSGETAIDFFVPSPDGQRVAVSLSEHGTEDGSLHIFDVASGEVMGEPIAHVNLMGGSVAWRHDGSGFWYTRCADPAGFRQQVWLRELDDRPDRVDLARPLRRRADRGELPVRLARRPLGDGPGAAGRRRRVADLRPGAGRRRLVVAGGRCPGQVRLRRARPGRPVPAVGPGRPARQGAPPAAEPRHHGRRGRGDRAGREHGHRRPGGDRRHRLGRGHGRRAAAGARLRHPGQGASPGADPAAELGVVVPRWPFAAGPGSDRLVARVLHRARGLVGGGPRPGAPAHRAEDDHARRPVRVRGDTRVRDVQGRHPYPAQRDRRPRHAPGRDRAGAADRVRRLRPLAGAALRSRAAAVAGAGRGLGGGQHPRRRRVRRGMASRRRAGHQAELLRRLHRLRRPPRCAAGSPAATGWPSWAVPTEAC